MFYRGLFAQDFSAIALFRLGLDTATQFPIEYHSKYFRPVRSA